MATAEELRRELDLLISLGHPGLILNLSACRSFDLDGVMLILDTYKQFRARGRRVAVVAGEGLAARLVRLLRLDCIIPIFPTEGSAELVLRGGAPAELAPVTWAAARAESLAMWTTVLQALDVDPDDEISRRITSSHGLCRRADIVHARSRNDTPRCVHCPLFQVLGGAFQDLGCRSAIEPMLDALQRHDRAAARKQVSRLIHTIEEMPLPENEGA